MIQINTVETLGTFAKYLNDHAHGIMIWYDNVEATIEELFTEECFFKISYVLRELTGTWTIVLTIEDEEIDGGGELTIICEEN